LLEGPRLQKRLASLGGFQYVPPMASARASAAALDLTPAASPEHDPIWDAILRAPLAEEPETEEERTAFDAIESDIRAGRSRRGALHR
jgi:hypothetical protein